MHFFLFTVPENGFTSFIKVNEETKQNALMENKVEGFRYAIEVLDIRRKMFGDNQMFFFFWLE